MTSADQRSVGELLLEAEQTARTVLMDVQEMDAATMLRTWGEVVQAAGELWQALPHATPPRPGTDQRAPDAADLTMQRLQAMTDSRHRGANRRDWPGEGPPDEHYLQIAGSFARAEDLISRHGTRQSPLSAPELKDLNAARTRIMHTLYIGSHGVTVAVGGHLRELEATMANRGGLPAGESLRQARTAFDRITAFEQLAGSVVSGTYPDALTGEHRELPAPDRLAQALASWDVVSHRVLVNSTRTADLTLTAQTQALILAGSNTLLRAAAHTGNVDQTEHRVRLDPVVAAVHERWHTLAGMWADLTAIADRSVNPDLAGASLEARAALSEILHDAAVAATVSVIAQRTDLSRTPGLVQQVLAANLDLAHVASEAAKDPQLTGAARGVNTMAIATRRRDPRLAHTIDDSPVDAVVAPRDLLANRAVPLPHIVRVELLGAAGSLVNAAGTAMSAGAQLESPTPKARHYGAPEPIHGRATQDRTPVRMPSRGPAGPGCAR